MAFPRRFPLIALELRDLAQERPELVEGLLAELERLEREAPEYPRSLRVPEPPSEAMLDHLRGIGYLGDD